MNKIKLFTIIVSVTLTVLIGVVFVFADWRDATGIPPANNTPEPINVKWDQIKREGTLTLWKDLIIGDSSNPNPTNKAKICLNGDCIDKWLQAAPTAVMPAPTGSACNFDGTWEYNDEGGGNDFQLSCKDGRILGWCGASTLSRGLHPGVYACAPWQEVLTANKPAEDLSNWATEKEATWVADTDIAGVRVSGDSDDGGYCYAYWGSGHIETYRHDPSTGYYNVDKQFYDGSAIVSGGGVAGPYDGDAGCSAYPGADAQYDPYTESMMCVYPGTVTGYNTCPANPPVFTNDGTAKICQVNWNAGGFATRERLGVNISSGTTIHLKSNFADGPDNGHVNCKLEVWRK